jgi:hypothetical protein
MEEGVLMVFITYTLQGNKNDETRRGEWREEVGGAIERVGPIYL